MKKLAFTLLAISLFQVAWAQSPLTLGPKIGSNYSTLVLSDDQKKVHADYFLGMAGGLFVRLDMGKLYLQPELYLNGKGSDFTIDNSPVNSNTALVFGKVRLTALDMPVLLGYKLIDARFFNLRMMGGPVVSWILKENRNDLKVLEPESYEPYNGRNIGFQAGLGLDIANLTIDARYEAGLNKINSHFNQRSNLFHVSLGFKFF